MAKTKEIFVCDQCGNESLQWQGICLSCGAADTLKRMSTRAKGRGNVIGKQSCHIRVSVGDAEKAKKKARKAGPAKPVAAKAAKVAPE